MRSFIEYFCLVTEASKEDLLSWGSFSDNAWGKLEGPFSVGHLLSGGVKSRDKSKVAQVLSNGKVVSIYLPTNILSKNAAEIVRLVLENLFSRATEPIKIYGRRVVVDKSGKVIPIENPSEAYRSEKVKELIKADEDDGRVSLGLSGVENLPLERLIAIPPRAQRGGTRFSDLLREGEPKTWALTLADEIDKLVDEGLIDEPETRNANDMFRGYFVVRSGAQPDLVLLISPFGASEESRGDEKAVYILKRKLPLIEPGLPWKSSSLQDYDMVIRKFSQDPLLYLKSFISPTGPFPLLSNPVTRKDAPARQKNFYYKRLENLFDEDIVDPNSKKPRLLFRYYLEGLGLAGQDYGREIDRDRSDLLPLLRAFAEGKKLF